MEIVIHKSHTWHVNFGERYPLASNVSTRVTYQRLSLRVWQSDQINLTDEPLVTKLEAAVASHQSQQDRGRGYSRRQRVVAGRQRVAAFIKGHRRATQREFKARSDG